MLINQVPISTDMSCSVIERPPFFLNNLPRAGCPPNPKKKNILGHPIRYLKLSR